MTRNDAAVPDIGRDALTLAGLLAGRLCHDLSGAAGTILNALALADADASAAAEALSIAREAADSLVGRMRFLDAAWGGSAGAMTVDQLRALANGMKARRLQVVLHGLDPAVPIGAGASRLLLNIVLLGAEALPEGGTLAFSGHPAGEVLVAIEGRHAAWPTGFALCLASEAEAWERVSALAAAGSVRGLQAPLTALIARAEGLRMSILMAPAAEAAPPLLLDLRTRAHPA